MVKLATFRFAPSDDSVGDLHVLHDLHLLICMQFMHLYNTQLGQKRCAHGNFAPVQSFQLLQVDTALFPRAQFQCASFQSQATNTAESSSLL